MDREFGLDSRPVVGFLGRVAWLRVDTRLGAVVLVSWRATAAAMRLRAAGSVRVKRVVHVVRLRL